MCNPTVAMVAISAGSAALQYKIGAEQQKAENNKQKRQNQKTKSKKKRKTNQ